MHEKHTIDGSNTQDNMVEIVLKHSRQSGSRKVLLLALAFHNTPEGADLTLDQLSKYANIRRRAVRDQLAELRLNGEIEVEVAGGAQRMSGQRSNRYHILAVCPAECGKCGAV